MTYLDEWRALSARLKSLAAASQTHAQHMAVNTGDPFARARRLLEHAKSALDAVAEFAGRHGSALPERARRAIERVLEQARPLVQEVSGTMRNDAASASILLIELFESEMSHLLADSRAVIVGRCERAFEHLRRSLVVDPTLCTLWGDAYREGEPACEKLGAVHLLHHGIWTFKANTEGARTDLIYGTPVDLDQAVRADAGLVLTEWKRAEKNATAGEVAKRFTEAREQAQRYAEGALAGIELADQRYLVLVSWEDVESPPDVTVRSVLYRHVNIPIVPRQPSRPRPQRGA